jgi:hypothetical protein
MEPEVSLPGSQGPATGLYPEPYEFSPFRQIYSNIILAPITCLYTWEYIYF